MGVVGPSSRRRFVWVVVGLLLGRLLTAPVHADDDLRAASRRAFDDMIYHYWDPQNVIPRIRPLRAGYVDNTAPKTTFWQMCLVGNLLYWEFKLTGEDSVKAMIASQLREIMSIYTPAQLASADPKINTGTVNAEDDAALASNYFIQAFEVTRDPRALRIAHDLIASSYRFFADPNRSGAGLLYAVAGEDPGHQRVSQLIEASLARSALFIFSQTGEKAYLERARESWSWIRKYLDAAGESRALADTYFCELDLDPAHGDRFRRPVLGAGIRFYSSRGSSLSYIGGNMAFGSLSGALSRLTGEPAYRTALIALVGAMTRRETFARPGAAGSAVSSDVFVDDRDAWSDGYFAPGFVADAASLPGVDVGGRWRQTLLNTANAIVRQRTADGYYTPDWSGEEYESSGRYSTWVAQSRNGDGGSGAGMAVPQQEMTSAQSVALVLAAAMAAGTPGALPPVATPATRSGVGGTLRPPPPLDPR